VLDRIDVIQTETINPQSVATIIASPICPAHIVEAYDTDASAPQRYPALEGRPGVDIERIEKVGVAGIDA
jgi:hypothetical protein